MLAALGIFVIAAALAAYRCAASYYGGWQALPVPLAVAAALVLRASAYLKSRPAALKIGAQGLTAWDKAGRLLVQGRVSGCAQWSDRLLVLTVKPDHGSSHTLLLPADIMPRPAFRGLAVLGRRAAGA